MSEPVAAVLFDLDGTLLDTAPDLGFALNQVCQQYGRPEVAEHIYTPVASHGSRGLLELAFADRMATEGDQLRQQFLAIYQDNIARQSRLFEGVSDLLGALNNNDIATAIVTNKPIELSKRLLPHFPILSQIPVLVGGDSLPVAKPNPEPLLHAAAELGVNPQHCVYVGDAERDIQAGHNAGMVTVLANYGYISDGDQPQCWQADYQIDRAIDLLTLLAIAVKPSL